MKVILSRNVIDADRLVTGHGHRSPGSRDPRAIAAHVSLSSRSLVKERRGRTPRNQRSREPGHPARHPGRPPGPALRHTEPQKTARQPVPSREEPPSSFTPRTYGSETRRPQARFPSGKTPPTPPRDPIQTLQGPATEPPAGTTSPQRRRRWPLYRTTNQTLSTAFLTGRMQCRQRPSADVDKPETRVVFGSGRPRDGSCATAGRIGRGKKFASPSGSPERRDRTPSLLSHPC
jgi:hypothetical protein